MDSLFFGRNLKKEKKNSLKIECVCSESTLAKSTAKEAGLNVLW